MQVKFNGHRPLIGWYGIDLIPGEEVTIPDDLAWRVENNPHLFEAGQKRRGRPPKQSDDVA